jgi:proline iminopeptidase
MLHGGPGAPLGEGSTGPFDGARHLVVNHHQRQCGRSTPSAAEPHVDLNANTTAHLVADLERLRDHLGIERWLVWGGSWGTTLALAYAEAHPARVASLLLVSVVTTTRREVDWVTRAMGRVFPRQWEAFCAALPASDREGDLAAAYARLLADPDPAVHGPAAAAWCAWEDTHVATVPGHRPDPRFDDPRFRLAFARLVTHYWSHAAFLPDGQLLRDAGCLAGIPTILIHGQLDVSGPLDIPWELARAIPGAELVVVDGEGHGGAGGTRAAMAAAVERLAGHD